MLKYVDNKNAKLQLRGDPNKSFRLVYQSWYVSVPHNKRDTHQNHVKSESLMWTSFFEQWFLRKDEQLLSVLILISLSDLKVIETRKCEAIHFSTKVKTSRFTKIWERKVFTSNYYE